MIRLSACLIILMTALLLSSCGSAFQKPWQSALSKPLRPGSIEGPWVGFWKSNVSGHTGDLRCLVGPQQGSGLEFYYHATWGKGLFRGAFKDQHRVISKGAVTTFTAGHSIDHHGFFQAEGTITPASFTATYQAAGDRGMFELKRPPGMAVVP